MKANRAVVFILSVWLCFSLTGCGMFSVDTERLMSPPELTGDMYPISQALSKSIKGDYQLKYPSSGERRSAIILEDIDDDGTFEAFAFYSTQDDEMTNMHINAIRKDNKGYTSVAEQSIVAGGVERVDFCDLDGDGKKEILVGWEVYGLSEKQLCVYSLTDKALDQRLLEKYTGFSCCDLTLSGENELFIHLLNTSDMLNSAAVYKVLDGGLQKIGGCVLDLSVKTVSPPITGKLSGGQTAIYIDEIKGAGAVTEVLFFKDGELKNPLLETENTVENIRTLRSASIASRDIDSDGVIEIPVATKLPNATSSDELLYYTNWCVFDGENLVTKSITVLNTIDGYYIEVPKNLEGHIAVLKDTESHRRVFYHYDAENESVGERLFSISVLSAKIWDGKDYNRADMFELARANGSVYIGSVNIASVYRISEKQLKEIFRLVQ